MTKFLNLFENWLFLSLFVLAGLTMLIVMQADNNAVQPIADNQLFSNSIGNVSANLASLQGKSGSQYDQFTREQPKAGFGSIVLFGIVSSGKTFGSVSIDTFKIIYALPLAVLEIPETLLSTISTWVIIALIISTWLLYKLGG